MKKIVLGFTFLIVLSMPIFTQEFYFDIGINNIGVSLTAIDDNNSSSFGAGLGLKVGFGPLGNIPIYIVYETFESACALSGNKDYFIDQGAKTIRVLSFFWGAGVIYYPVSLIQLGLTFGYSSSYNNAATFDYGISYSGGYGWNISVAFDLGKNNHGCLIGLNYSGAYNWLVESRTKMLSTDLGIFLKYAYRRKVSKQNTDISANQSTSDS